jgi:uncharacterized protein YbjT (DUF2867 family)
MDWYSQESFCKDLPTIPVPKTGIVLVTGAGGYIGGRLVPELIERGYRVRIMVRKYSEEQTERWPDAEVVIADALNIEQLRWVLKDVSVAYYLIHSMLIGKRDFAASDLQAAKNFRDVAAERNLNRIIYLGALGDSNLDLSNHLESRIKVATILSQGEVPTTILQAAIIIGSGSASFEMLESIARNAIIVFNPSWAKTLCQPIGLRDVIKYLVGVLETEETIGNQYDIGGEDIISYKEMLKVMAKVLHKRRLHIPSPVSSIRLYSYIVSLISPVPASIVECLMESVKNDVVVRDDKIRHLIDFKTIRFKTTLLRALSREEHDKIATRWSDAYPPAHELSMKLSEITLPPKYISRFSILSDESASAIFESVCKIGGKKGWFHSNWMWQIRGRIDRVFLGVGMARGRRSASSLRINDVIDFWRVENLVRNKKLLLRAEMILPGKAWLEFTIDKKESKRQLTVVAYFQPKRLIGKMYWYFFLPFHFIIFKDLLKQLTK